MSISPEIFLEESVQPSVNEWFRDPCSLRKAAIAIHFLNVMAERYWQHWSSKSLDFRKQFKTALTFRKYLAIQNAAVFQTLRDLDDLHKHVSLNRTDAIISDYDTFRIQLVTGLGDACFGEATFGGDMWLVVSTKSNSEYRVDHVIMQALDFWKRKVAKEF